MICSCLPGMTISVFCNNGKKLKGIVINAFSESFVIPVELFDLIAEMPSCFETREEAKNE
jgi:hypothetical protein